MEVSVIKYAMYNNVFSPSGECVDDVLVRLPLIKHIIKHVNLMCVSFSAKHPQILWGS